MKKQRSKIVTSAEAAKWSKHWRLHEQYVRFQLETGRNWEIEEEANSHSRVGPSITSQSVERVLPEHDVIIQGVSGITLNGGIESLFKIPNRFHPPTPP